MAGTKSLGLARHSHRDLIKKVWPDKLLYGSIMLLITATIGLLHALVVWGASITYSKEIPAYLHPWPAEVTALLSAGAAVAAIVSLKQLSNTWGIAGAAAGIASMGMLGLGSALSLVAGVFLVISKIEGEDRIPASKRLDPSEWPDKSLAASLLILMAALLSGVWGWAILQGDLVFGGPVMGGIGVAAALAGLVAAYLLYHQRGFAVGLVASGLSLAAVGGYILGPLLALAAIVLLFMAKGEGEFEEADARAPSRTATAK